MNNEKTISSKPHLLDVNTLVVDAEQELPMSLFAGVEDAMDCQKAAREIEMLTSIITAAHPLPQTQRTAVFEAVRYVVEHESSSVIREYGLELIGQNLHGLGSAAARNAYTKLYTLFEGIRIRESELPFKSKPICEIDVNAFAPEGQEQIIKFYFAYLYAQALRDSFIQKGLAIVVDEAQNMPLEKGQIMSRMLMESRKKNVRLVLASPEPVSRSVKNDAMFQCATQCFFKPAGSPRELAKMISPKEIDRMTLVLNGLKRAEFVATGRLVNANGDLIKTPILLRTDSSIMLD